MLLSKQLRLSLCFQYSVHRFCSCTNSAIISLFLIWSIKIRLLLILLFYLVSILNQSIRREVLSQSISFEVGDYLHIHYPLCYSPFVFNRRIS